MVVATQPLPTCYLPQADGLTYAAVMGVCGMSGEWQRVLELLSLGSMFTWVSQHFFSKRLVFESEIGSGVFGVPIFETHRILMLMAEF